MEKTVGEANMTVITIVLIGIIAAVGLPLISNLMTSTKNQTCCSNAGGDWTGNTCQAPAGAAGKYFDQATYDACIKED